MSINVALFIDRHSTNVCYFINRVIYLRKCVLQLLYANKFSKCPERAECTSAVCDNTAVVSQRN